MRYSFSMDPKKRSYKMIFKSQEMMAKDNKYTHLENKENIGTYKKIKNRLCNCPLSPVKQCEPKTSPKSPKIIVLEDRILQKPLNKYPDADDLKCTDVPHNHISEVQVTESTTDEAASSTARYTDEDGSKSTDVLHNHISEVTNSSSDEPSSTAKYSDADDLQSTGIPHNYIPEVQVTESAKYVDIYSYTSDDDIPSPYYDSDADPPYSPSTSKGKHRYFKNLLSPPRTRKSSKSDSSRDETNASLEQSVLGKEIAAYSASPGTPESKFGVSATINEQEHNKYIACNNSKITNFDAANETLQKNSEYENNLSEASTEFAAKAREIKVKYIRKPDFCYFCETEVYCFARHITRNHSLETEVQKILAFPPKDKIRRHLLNLIRKRGNYLKNSCQLFKPVRSSSNSTRNDLPCTICLGFFSAKLLYRHRKVCNGTKGNAQSDGQNMLVSHIRVDKKLKNEVFPHMRPDKISLEAKSDKLICAFGARYIKIHRENHLIPVASRKMREVARILIEIKKLEPQVKNLFEALQPKYFDLFIKGTKIVAKFDECSEIFGSPTFAMNMATSLKQCCDVALTLVLKDQTRNMSVSAAESEARLKNMITLFETNWKYEISSQAANNLNMKKWNKLTIVPLASDLRKMKQYLSKTATDAIKQLELKPTDVKAFTLLLETIYCRLMLLNRKRPGELQRLLVHTYVSASSDKKSYEEFSSALCPTEQVLLNSLKRVTIRGKRGRGVPVLFTADIQEHINALIKLRLNFFDNQNPYLFGKPFKTTSISGYKVLEKHAKASGASHPSALTATRLRKHIATLTQLLIMNDSEIEQLATFMGHTIGVHKNSYRLPDDIYQTAKLSKLLLLMEKGGAAEFKGKSLDEIEINMDEDVFTTEENNDIDSEPDDLTYNEVDSVTESLQGPSTLKTLTPPPLPSPPPQKNPRKKRILVPWSTDQKAIVKCFFANHIQNKVPPKRMECEQVINQNKTLLANKSWLKIKVFIQNEYKKQK